jgi:tetratricopeptide (TPR) repeat protein
MNVLNNLLKQAESLFNNGKYNEIIALLPDEVLDKLNNADLYARLAWVYIKLNNFDKVLEYANKAISIDPNNSSGYRQRGVALFHKGESEKSFADFDKAVELNKNFAEAYYSRALSWSYLGDYNKAIEDYGKAIELKKDYTSAYINRGSLLHNQEEYDKSIADFDKAIELEDDSSAYNNRANSFYKRGDYESAFRDYNKAIELNPGYANAYHNRGEAFFDRANYLNAIEDYQRAIELDPKFGFLEIKLKLAIEKREERKILEESKALQTDKDEKLIIEKEIEKLITQIRMLSKSEVKTVVHYTKVLVVDIYVKKSLAKMHYSNAIYMNDPMEGKVFFEYLDDKSIELAYLNGEKRTETSVYLGSFLPAEENDGEISHEDELVMWRTYGKDENGKEAAGCSVVLSSDFFKMKPARNEDLTIKENSEELLNVVYINKLRNKKEIANDPKGEIEPAIKALKLNLKKLIELKNKYKPKDDFYKEIENTIFKQLSTISYLFKSADYNFEHEVRVITYMPRDSESVKFREITEPDKPNKRFYIESNNDILPFVKKIFLGPKVEHYQQWSLYFDYEIRQRAKDLEKMTTPPYRIKAADIEIMKSECKFQ